MQVFIYCKFTPHVSGVHRTHHEYIKLYLQPLVQVISRNSAKTFHQRGLIRPNKTTLEEGRCTVTCYDLYQRLQLQFYLLLVIGAMDTRNM